MRKINIVIAVIIIILLAGVGAWYFGYSRHTYVTSMKPIIVGGPALEQSAFIYIAAERGFFGKNGLNVTIRDNYPNGVVPINDLLQEKLDISVSAGYQVVIKAFQKENIKIIGVIDKYQNEIIIGRKDRGIQSISDLKGKKIGVPRGTICEFFLGRFLDLNGMRLRDVNLVDVQAAESVQMITSGAVDGIIYFQPYVYEMKSRLGANGVVWPAQNNQLLYGILSCRGGWVTKYPDLVERFLRALAQAEDYLVNHPVEAKAVVQERLHLSAEYITNIWSDHQFTLSLDQSLLIAMNDEGRWVINNHLTSEKFLPDFRDYIYTKGLEEVKPEAVNIR